MPDLSRSVLARPAMGALAFDPNNPSVIYAGTGEQNFSLDSYYGNGVLKSTNGGVTWSVLGTATFARQTISRIVVSPSNSQVVFAASNNGLFRSSDGGNTWTRVLAGVATDCIAQPGSGSVFYSAIHSSGVFKSTDGGANWTKLAAGLPASNIGRIHLTISVAAPNTLLASFTARDNKLEGLYRSTDAGANWTKLVNTPNVFGGQGWYNVSLGLHPTNANVMYFGGLSLWRSLDGGTNWTNISNPRDYFLDVHPDQHAIAFNPQNPAVIWIGNDGGVWRSDNGGDTWLSRNDGLSLTQFQTVALHPTNDALAFGGTQDNGIQKYTGNSEWRETRTGDNGSTYFDFNAPPTIYSTYVLGSLIKSLSSGEPGTWAGATNGIPFSNGAADGRSAFYAPFTMSPTNPLQLAFGSYRVWYTTDGMTNWNAVSGDVTGGGVVSAITIAANGTRIWTGSSDAQVWRGDLSGGSWSFTSVTKAPLPNRAITRIAAHPAELATGEMGATLPLPTTLAGTTVRIKDSAGVERLAPLFYVAPLQVNYLLPIGTAPGLATVMITNGAGKVSAGAVTIIPVAPGLFTANQDGAGAPAGFAIRVKPNGDQSRESLSRLDTATGKQVPAPIDLGPEGEVIILELYGTGIRGRSSQAVVNATMGGVVAGIEYADRQPGFVGLDQVNIRVPRSLIGRGEMDLVLMVEGKAAHTVKVSIR